MKKGLFFIIFVSVLFFHFDADALECNSEDKQRLQKLSNNINVTLEEINNNGNLYLNATFTGVAKDLRVFSEQKLVSFYNSSDNFIGEAIVSGLFQGKTYTFIIYGKHTCVFDELRRITINVPVYNQYYNDSICNGLNEYKLCQKWANVDMSYEEFANKVKEYSETKKTTVNNSENKHNGHYFSFYNFYMKYFIYVLVALVLILSILIRLWIKENKRNQL